MKSRYYVDELLDLSIPEVTVVQSVPSAFRYLRGVGLVRCLVIGLALTATLPVAAGDDGLSVAMARFRQELSRVRPGGAAEDGTGLETFQQVLSHVLRTYVRPVSADALVRAAIGGLQRRVENRAEDGGMHWLDGALDGMMSSLDPYSAYMTARDYATLRARISGRFGGIGVELALDRKNGLARVVAPFDGGPAAGAGLRPGDLISAVGGVSVSGLSLQDISALIRGEPGTSIQLTLVRSEQQRQTLTLVRELIKIEPVTVRVDGSIALIRISSFNLQVAGAFDRAVVELGRQAGAGLTGVVLDLRNNPGGVLDQAVIVAGRFLSVGTIVSVRGRQPADNVHHMANRGDAFAGLPLVVLINGGSASSSEIVSAALQDHRRAVVFGARSFGKGSVLSTTGLESGGALIMTTARYYRPSGASVECFGVTPNVVVTSESAGEREGPGACPSDPAPPEPVARWSMEDVCPEIVMQASTADRTYACARAALQNGIIARK